MNYLNDLAQTGMDDEGCLKLFLPSVYQTIHRIDQNLPKWTRMLQDGLATCCFAVAVDDCLVRRGPGGRMCGKQRGTSISVPWHDQYDLLSTTINLQENPSVELPLTRGVILKLESGRLIMSSDHREGHAQLAKFWLPGLLDKAAGWILDTRTHTELLDPDRSTGLWADVCIMDR